MTAVLYCLVIGTGWEGLAKKSYMPVNNSVRCVFNLSQNSSRAWRSDPEIWGDLRAHMFEYCSAIPGQGVGKRRYTCSCAVGLAEHANYEAN